MKPTSIYWLLDVRPATLATHPAGYPFYCGHTVLQPTRRLAQHIRLAGTTPDRKVCQRLLACGKHVRIVVVEIVPPDGNWRARERRWIKTLRFSFPDNCNESEPLARCAVRKRDKEKQERLAKARRATAKLARNRIRRHRQRIANSTAI